MSKPPRVWVSSATPRKGEVLRVRAQIEHVMESGQRQDADQQCGQPCPAQAPQRFMDDQARDAHGRSPRWQ